MNMIGNYLTSKIKTFITGRNVLFFLIVIFALSFSYIFVRPLFDSGNMRHYSHIPLIPLITIYLFFIRRKSIFQTVNFAFAAGIPVLLVGIILFGCGLVWGPQMDSNNYASIIALSLVVFINGAFIFLYGIIAYKAALFPLLFLIFTVPIPTALMDKTISFLQSGSAEFTNLLFLISGIPFLREGVIFHLPSLSVEVAPECSGIRSALAIFIIAILAGNMFLKTYWKRIVLAVCAVLIAMFKNGIRILTLSLLGNYVDTRVLESSLHREGGIPFFAVALILLAPVLFLLRKTENFKDEK